MRTIKWYPCTKVKWYLATHSQTKRQLIPTTLGGTWKRFCWFSAQANPPCPPVVLLHHRAGYVHCKRPFQFCRTTNLGIGHTVIVQKVHSGSPFRGVFTFTHKYFTAVWIQLARCPHHQLLEQSTSKRILQDYVHTYKPTRMINISCL